MDLRRVMARVLLGPILHLYIGGFVSSTAATPARHTGNGELNSVTGQLLPDPGVATHGRRPQ